MRHFIWVVASTVALAMSAEANALGALARVSVVDRDSGAELPAYYARGEYWVAGNPGARYAIEIRSCAGGRLLAVTSVDGVNVLSGDTAGFDQDGYVFDPGQSYQITGWRKSNSEVAAFTFTDSHDSYAARTGRAANVGVIGVALFREQAPQAYRGGPDARPTPAPAAGTAGRAEAYGRLAESVVAGASPPVAASAPAPAARLGTGHGEREYSYVVDTEFRRLQPTPNEVVRIRYDSYQNLVAMGIIRKPRPTPRAPDAFPGSEQPRFVPDPPGGG